MIRDVAALIAETMQMPLCGSLEPAAGGFRMQLRSSSSPTEADQVVHLYPSAMDSMVAYAMRIGQPVACPDLAAEIRFRDRLLLDRGMVSALMAPLKLENRELGGVIVCTTRTPIIHRG